MKRALVTGATGFIGRHYLAALASLGYKVHAVTSREVRTEFKKGDVIRQRANLLEHGAARAMFESVRPTHLLHLAWYAEPGKF